MEGDEQTTVERAWALFISAAEWESRCAEDLDKARSMRARASDLYERVLRLQEFPGYVAESDDAE